MKDLVIATQDIIESFTSANSVTNCISYKAMSGGWNPLQCRAVGSGAAGAALAAPLFWPLIPFDYEHAGGLHQQGTTRTLLRCTGSVELAVKHAADRSPGYADETGHTPFSLRARGLTLASQSTRYSVHF